MTKKQQRQFLDLPMALYRDSKQWVPRIRASERELVNFCMHPFYKDADSVAFLATKNGQPCGRVVALQNHAHDRQHPKESLGFLAFYDSADDADVAAALFDAAAEWIRSRGLTHMRGPVSPSMNYEAGVLIEGFEHMPTFMMPYNAPYYQALWEDDGFEKVQDLFAFGADKSMFDTMNQKARKIARAATERFGISYRMVSRKSFADDLTMFLSLYNEASKKTWGFVPLSSSEIGQLSKELKHLIIPEMTMIASIEGKDVAAVFGMLDYNPIIQRIRGKLFPFGFLQILFGRKKIKRFRVMSINVEPKYQGWGLGVALMGHFSNQALAWGIEEVEFSYVLESNHMARASLENGGANREKTYRVYEKAV